MPIYCLLATEGPHDQAVITKLLTLSGFQSFGGDLNSLDPFWEGFIPVYPKKGKVYARLDMPSILTSPTHSIAIYCGEGSNLIPNLAATMTAFRRYASDIHAFGLIIDADKHTPGKVAKEKVQGLRSFFPSLSEIPGAITEGPPRTGIYVLPDNTKIGTLDSLLIDCAQISYPVHKRSAIQFVDSFDAVYIKHWRPFSHEKAIVASIVSILKPGMANTPSIAQDQWISQETINAVSDLSLLNQFLHDLLQLP